MKEKETEHLDAIYKTYGGKKRWCVKVPGQKEALRVAAPDENTAIVAAAVRLGKVWTKYEFYAYCEVMPA